MSLRAAIDATIGRRLLVRIWAHGVLLFVGVLVTVVAGRSMMSDVDDSHALRAHPYLAASVAERMLAVATEPVGLAREVRRIGDETPLSAAVFSADGALRASSGDPALTPPTAEETAALRVEAPSPTWHGERLVVGSFSAGQLVAIAVLRAPRPPSVPWHVVVLLGCALFLGFVFVAGPLTYSIARPIEKLRALANELGRGNLAVRSHATRRDEIGDLGRAFDAMAAHIQRLRDAERELLGDVSHELRTPLARMRVVLDLAHDADLARTQRYLGEITTDLADLEHLIDDIIVASRLDAETTQWDEARPPLRRQTLVVDELLDTAIDRFRATFPDRPLTVVRPPAGLVVDGDPAMLRRVLDNLLDNARKYSAEDAAIEIRVEHRDPDIHIEVVDRGIGISAEDQPRVFAGFFRADRSRTRSSGGVGLGLALARRIVTAHGGTIGFTSELDRGSRFWFSLRATTPGPGVSNSPTTTS